MKILVTGGAGYIGSACVENLCDSGHEVLIVDNLTEGHREAVDPRAELVVGDLADFELLVTEMTRFGAEAVIHFAAFALVGESMQDPAKYFRNNVGGGLSLLEAMVEAKVPRIVFSSTCATYGMPDRVPISEDTPQDPVNPYGESKLAFEKILRWFSEIHGIEACMFRYFNAAGATDRFGEDHRIETHLIPLILQVALGQRDHIEVYGTDYDTPDGTAIRDYIHVRDLADAHRLALEHGLTGQFNLGTGHGYSVQEVLDACRRLTGHPIPANLAPRRAGDPAALVADNAKLRAALPWEPQHSSLDSIISSAFAWHQAHPAGYATEPGP